MSDREKAYELLKTVPDYKIAYVIAYLQGITADEDADDRYCEELYQGYIEDDDPEKDVEYSLEDCKKEWGLA